MTKDEQNERRIRRLPVEQYEEPLADDPVWIGGWWIIPSLICSLLLCAALVFVTIT
jgi:hypothetical protein